MTRGRSHGPSAAAAAVVDGGASRPRVVVGVDGSPESVEALCWAIGYARRTGGSVCAVMAWQQPTVCGYSSYAGMFPVLPEVLSGAELAEKTTEKLAALINDVAGEAGTPSIQRLVVEGPPARALIERSTTADLLAVGARGHGALTDLLMGSVSTQCVHHAACPVLVVRRGAVRAAGRDRYQRASRAAATS